MASLPKKVGTSVLGTLLTLLGRPRQLLVLNIVSAAFSWGVYALLLGPWKASAVLIWLLLHEGGHQAVMLLQGLRPALIFVPVGGALSIPRSPFKTDLQAAVSTFGGLVTGTLAMLLFTLFGAGVSQGGEIIGLLGVLNLMNLAPISMMDGYRLFQGTRAYSANAVRLTLLAEATLILVVAGISLTSAILAVPFVLRALRHVALQTQPERPPLSKVVALGVCAVHLLLVAASGPFVR